MSDEREQNTLENDSTVQDYIVPSFNSNLVDTTYITLPWIGSWQIANNLFDDAKITKDLRGIRIVQQELINNNKGKKVYQISSHIKAPIGKTAIDILICEPIAGHISWLVFPATGGSITREPNDLYTDHVKFMLHIPPVLTHPVLDRDEILDNIARGENESSIHPFIHGESVGLLNDALHIFKIYSAKNHEKRKTYNEEGIKIFQQEYMVKNSKLFTTTGELCKNTMLAIDEALKAKWKRELCFYVKRSEISEVSDRNDRIYTKTDENFITDEDIQNNISNGVKIYGREKDTPEIYLGRQVIRNFKGLQRTSQPNFPLITLSDHLLKATANNEGGFDAINTWDNAYLSIGLYQWNRGELYDLMNFFKEEHPLLFTTLFSNNGFDINNNKFKIDGTEYSKEGDEKLRSLKLIWLFIKAADNQSFKDCQLKFAKKRINDKVKNVTVIVNEKNKTVKDFITSVLGTAQVLDQSVNRPGHVDDTVGKAAEEVIALLQTQWEQGMLSKLSGINKTFFENCFDSASHLLKSSLSESDKTQLENLVSDPANWGNYEESKILEKYLIIRPTIGKEYGTEMTDSENRAARIQAYVPSLSANRGSFNE